MKRTFREFPAFTRLVRSGQISDAQVAAVQHDIMSAGGVPIPGTGGVRTIRCAADEGGKRGGWRVLFADYRRHGLTFLIWAYPKTMRTRLTKAQQKAIAGLKRQIAREVEASYGKRD